MKVIGVKFKKGGKVYYFAPREDEIYEEEMQVVVETSKSVEFAYVDFLPREVDDSEVVQPLKPIIRIATERDREQVQKNIERKPQAMKIAQEKIEKHGLDMKLIDCEFSFDGNKVIFYFASEGRVDFRELVKDLAAAFHIRIELRQIGIRDETRLLGGIAPCGRECCCAGAMPDFCKVSIKMAKTQGLSLNPGKISGLCGRLMCCLSYENDYYSEASKKMPKVGSEVDTPEGIGTVVTENMLKMTVRVKIEKDGGLIYRDFPLDDIKFGKKECCGCCAKEVAADDDDDVDILPDEDDPAVNKERKDPKNSRQRNQNREPREKNQQRDGNQNREPREKNQQRDGNPNREPREKNQQRDGNQNREPREKNQQRDGNQNREPRERNQQRDGNPNREPRERNQQRDGNPNREQKNAAEQRDGNQPNEQRPRKDFKGKRNRHKSHPSEKAESTPSEQGPQSN